MPTVIHGKESVHSCGVTEVVSYLQELLESCGWQNITVHPYHPGHEANGNEKQLFSLPLPGANGYRIAVPAEIGPFNLEWVYARQLDTVVKIADVVQLHGPHQVNDHLQRACLRHKTPTVLFLHVDDAYYIDCRIPRCLGFLRDSLKEQQHRRARRMAELANVVVSPSRHYARVFQNHTGFNGEVIVAPSHVRPFALMNEQEAAVFSEQFRKGNLLVHPEAYPLIVFLGRLGPEKNCEFVLQVFAGLVELHRQEYIPGVTLPVLAFVGDSSRAYQGKLESLAKKWGIDHLVYFAGHRSHNEAMKILQISRLCLFPSTSETQGLVAAEARLCGTPVLVPQNTALAEFVPSQHSLLVLPQNSPQIWAASLHRLLSDSQLYQELAEKGRAAAKQLANPDAFLESTLNIYDLARQQRLARQGCLPR